MYTQGLYEIIKKVQTAEDTFDLTMSCGKLCDLADPGQFVHISVPGFFLRRPISICDIDKNNGTIRIVFQIKGKGTDALSKFEVGERLDMLGPLGIGFKLLETDKKVITVGGGIGTPPMLAVAKHYSENATAISGFRTKELVILQDDFKEQGNKTILCTDDGTAGEKGFVTDALTRCINEEKPDMIYACGPVVMLKAVSEIAKENEICCQISLEERMACGVGACLGCAVKMIRGGREFYGHVCKNGPVFDSKEVVL